MPFEPVARRPVSEVVFGDLRAAVLSGRFAPGDALPSERLLSEAFSVNRHAVREALKRLQQAGLVEVNHGGATRALDWRATGGLDLLAQLPVGGDQVGARDAEILRSVLEMRRCIGVDVARLAAMRASSPLVAELRARIDDGRAPGDDLGVLSERYEELWRTLVAAADNLAYALSYNSLLAVGHSAREVFEAEARDLQAHTALVDAVTAGDAATAAERADALFSRTLAAAFGALPTTSTTDA